MSRICLYYIHEPESDRWILGDRYIRPFVRRLVRGKPRVGGVERVFVNLCLGLDKLGIKYEVNLPFNQLKNSDKVGILGRGLNCLNGYDRPNPIVAGIGLMTHPSQWATLCEDYPVVKYLQHSEWANNVYKPYFGDDRCELWPVGIDTDKWKPSEKEKTIDFLIYNKIRWDYDVTAQKILQPIYKLLESKGLTFQELRYGFYQPEAYQASLTQCRAMIFLCEHESQGIAYQECLASGVPIIAWDQGQCLDPNRFQWGQPYIEATSVPYWDERCGVKFKNIDEFPDKLDEFLEKLYGQYFFPREYILENLTLEKCARKYLDILEKSYGNQN